MPPVNTPYGASPTERSRTASRPQTPEALHTADRPLTPLSYLSSPVLDLASTLHTSQADADADEANVTFLRDSLESLDEPEPRHNTIDPLRDPRRSHAPATVQEAFISTLQEAVPARSTEDVTRRDRLQRVLSRLNRLHEPSAGPAAYTNRSPNRQSLYDWAPASEEGTQDESELDEIVAELRQQQPDTHPEILRILGQSQLDGERERSQAAREGATRTGGMSDQRRRDELRSRAMLQRARREGSPSATERMLRYVMERERSGLSEEEERARAAGLYARSTGAAPAGTDFSTQIALERLRERDQRERVEAFRRGYLAESTRLPRTSTPARATTKPAPSSSLFESALKYLDALRNCETYEDALSAAIDNDLGTKEFFVDKEDEFILDASAVPPPAPSSWLLPGAVFQGNQHASHTTGSLLNARSRTEIEQINPNFRSTPAAPFDHPPGSTLFSAERPWLSHPPPPPPANVSPTPTKPPSHDQWPVRVRLHTIDTTTMTLTGTMEAYDVPQHQPTSLSALAAPNAKVGDKEKPIVTYLEGHILDLKTHTFLTPSPTYPPPTTALNARPQPEKITFPSADPKTDAANWRKLPPFSSLPTPDDVARTLLSSSAMKGILEEYVFMRWKEKCFVHSADDRCGHDVRLGDQDRGHGLTISGFYYVSLRRADGVVEGLYFDPTSSPFQLLRLRGVAGGGWGSWGFR